ncbi:hypothetical protein ACEQ8H_007923 [Pleosporales sp. CAS-2024a]
MAPKRKQTDNHSTTTKKLKLSTKNMESGTPADSASVSTSKVDSPSPSPLQESSASPPRVKTGKGEEKAAKEAKSGKGEWKLVDPTKRDAIKVGPLVKNDPRPQGLQLHFQNTKTGKKEIKTYSKKADEIDWNDKKKIDSINKWRRSMFNQRLSNKQEKKNWSEEEIAYVEIVFQKLVVNAAADKNAKLPTRRNLLTAFNYHFNEGRKDYPDADGKILDALKPRNMDSFERALRRQGTVIGDLNEQIKDRLKNTDKNVSVPVVTRAEIEAHMKKTKEAAKSGKTNKRKANTEDVATDSHETGKQDAAPRKKRCLKKFVDKPIPGPMSDKEPIHVPSSSQESSDQMMEPNHSNSRATAEISKRKAKRWLPATDDEAIQRHAESFQPAKIEDTWPMAPALLLDDRLKRYPIVVGNYDKPEDQERNYSYYNRNGLRTHWYQDVKLTTTQVKKGKKAAATAEQDHFGLVEGDRSDTAAALNAVLNYAIIPPFGYRGNLHDLVTDPRMPASERALAQISILAQKKFEAEHDKAYEKYCAVSEGEEGESEDRDEEADN